MSKKVITPDVKWKDITPGANIYDAGNSNEFITGDWSNMKPVLDREKCKTCLLCILACPDSVITCNEDKIEFDNDHCKGCGICVKKCAFGAIKLEEEE